jgi:mannitol/fructose-specific phosphotransferase system IIA component (Ntr-type)
MGIKPIQAHETNNKRSTFENLLTRNQLTPARLGKHAPRPHASSTTVRRSFKSIAHH